MRVQITLAAAGLLAACARPMIPPVASGGTSREIDAPCSASNVVLRGTTSRIDFAPLQFEVPSRWIPDYNSLNDVGFNLQKTASDLRVWKGGEFIFNPVLPLNSVQCELVRGDTTITIRTTVLMEGIRNYRVDVAWSPLIDGQHFYMQLQTRFPEHLRDVRGVIESVRAAPRATAARP
jgi:hypothetical protein